MNLLKYKKQNGLILVVGLLLLISGCTKEYFYYYNNEKIFLKMIGERDGNLVFVPKNNPSAEMVLTDQFIVKLKEGINANRLDSLNQKYKVQIVRNIYGTNDEFILKITSETKSNALDIANIYHNEPIIQWSQPDWIQKYDLNKENDNTQPRLNV